MTEEENRTVPTAKTRKQSFGSSKTKCTRRDVKEGYRREYLDMELGEALRLASALQAATAYALSHDKRNSGEREIRLWLAGDSDDNLSFTVFTVPNPGD